MKINKKKSDSDFEREGNMNYSESEDEKVNKNDQLKADDMLFL